MWLAVLFAILEQILSLGEFLLKVEVKHCWSILLHFTCTFLFHRTLVLYC